MPVPWLSLVEAALGLTDLARTRWKGTPSQPQDPQRQLEVGGGALGGLETRLAGVVVAALQEAFDRDSRRLDLEREQQAAERDRAERALRLELRRQAGDREIGRLRLLGGLAAASWVATLMFSTQAIGGGAGARLALGAGWMMLLGAFGAAFAGQSRVADALSRTDEGSISSGLPGAFALILLVGGLALVAVAVLVARQT
jgi:hypothetical protein